MSATVSVIPAPACTAWCEERHGSMGWDEVGRDTTKRCRRLVTSPGGVEVFVERFVDVCDGMICVGDIEARIYAPDALTFEDVGKLAETLRQILAEIS